jgi:hypothetical protein
MLVDGSPSGPDRRVADRPGTLRRRRGLALHISIGRLRPLSEVTRPRVSTARVPSGLMSAHARPLHPVRVLRQLSSPLRLHLLGPVGNDDDLIGGWAAPGSALDHQKALAVVGIEVPGIGPGQKGTTDGDCRGTPAQGWRGSNGTAITCVPAASR